MRSLTIDEISILEKNRCQAEDWTRISVGEDFLPETIFNVNFYGEVSLGVFDKQITVEDGFLRHTGIRNATLRDVTIGDNCLIENIGNYISRYDIAEETVITNVGTIATTDGATFGQGNKVAVLNEAGKPNVIIYDGLTSQMASLMTRWLETDEERNAMMELVAKHVAERLPKRGYIGYRVKITNTREVVNTIVDDECEINGASSISETTLKGSQEASVFVGHDVICENTVVQPGASVVEGAKLSNCLVGEACHIGRGFSAESSLFFANSHMDNGEACAAVCGPFSASHHKASLLIGVEMSFYNAGSATNFSNHAYKMGPIHQGNLMRGAKTASGAHTLLPANIGPFSVCIGKIQSHPDTTTFPFSYVIGEGRETWLVPAINIATAGTWRDINKWPKRDRRPADGRKSIVNTDWLNPMVVDLIVAGKARLEKGLDECPSDETITFDDCHVNIKRTSAKRGVKLYENAIMMFLADNLDTVSTDETPLPNISPDEEWADMGGLIAPLGEVVGLCNDIVTGITDTVEGIEQRMATLHSNYSLYKKAYARRLALDVMHTDTLTDDHLATIKAKGKEAKDCWLNAIVEDAKKESGFLYVPKETFENFKSGLKE